MARLSQYADPAAGSLPYGVNVAYCSTADATYAVPFSGNASASNGATANLLTASPASFNLTGSAFRDVALAKRRPERAL